MQNPESTESTAFFQHDPSLPPKFKKSRQTWDFAGPRKHTLLYLK